MKVVDKQSKFQKIILEDVGDQTILWLDGYLQFDTRYERDYHELIMDVPLLLARHARTVLIMGGGDGLAARQALAYPTVKMIVNVELDPEMVAIARKELVKLNRGSFLDERVTVVVGDAYKIIQSLPKRGFDVIAADFPADTSREIHKLYSDTLYMWVKERLAPGGVFVTQVSEGPKISAKIEKRLWHIFGHSARVTLAEQDWIEQFVYASEEPLSQKRANDAAIVAMDAAKKLTHSSDVVVNVSGREREDL